jgi:hypothetical protein
MVALSPSAETLTAVVHACASLTQARFATAEDAVDRADSISSLFMLALEHCAQAGWSREQMRDEVAPARAVYALSPFAARL